ncbi:hypothetical protein DICVIV_09403 [Dictyocaulus viviparus]|uniref:Uncharacterized protein n=1 Tax=Dictyocaulus viviparus TaxID=29172 RepID=A0A0D8XIZ0_DICVI|nr:hypothetical protein DICVIV_09403 [Dictyocaulus viviparus]
MYVSSLILKYKRYKRGFHQHLLSFDELRDTVLPRGNWSVTPCTQVSTGRPRPSWVESRSGVLSDVISAV